LCEFDLVFYEVMVFSFKTKLWLKNHASTNVGYGPKLVPSIWVAPKNDQALQIDDWGVDR